MRGFLFPVPGAADGLRRPGVQPGANDLVEPVCADQGERAPERGLLRRPADRSEPGQHAGPTTSSRASSAPRRSEIALLRRTIAGAELGRGAPNTVLILLDDVGHVNDTSHDTQHGNYGHLRRRHRDG
jgi:hypothetical protein